MVVWLRTLVKDGTNLILTTRPTSELPKTFRKQVKQFIVQPFSAEQQKQLAENWLGGRAFAFQTAFSRFAGGELGGTPLLLTIAAIVYHDSGELPRRRSELYREFVNNTWEEALKHVERDDSVSQLFQDLRALVPICLKKLALRMTESKGEAAALDFGTDILNLTNSIAELLLNLSEPIAAFRAAALVKFLEVRSGILRATAHQFEWVHPTFREFLAAEEIAEKSNGAQVEEILRRFKDVAWRQVVLFLISILSERQSVTRELRLLKELEPPFGLALAGFAISEGADVDRALAKDVVRNLCDAVRAEAEFEGGLCARLLTVDGGGGQARGALLPFMTKPEVAEYTYTDRLKHDLVQLAYRYGKSGSCPVEDLRELQARDALAQIATALAAPFMVRVDAAKSMYPLGSIEDGCRIFEELAVATAGDSQNWHALISALAELDDAGLYAALASHGVLAHPRFGDLLDHIKDNSKQKVWVALASDVRLSDDQLLAVRLRAAEESDYIDTLISSLIDQPVLLGSCLDVLVRSGNRSALVRAALCRDIPLGIRTQALRALKKLGAQDELRKIVRSGDLPFSLRRRSAEYLYKSPLNKESAGLLLDFFNSIGTHTERPGILVRRGFLHYILEQYTEALSLFERLFNQRPAMSWEFGVFGRSLESLDRREEALAAYDKALQLDPGNVFAHCRRAVVHWEYGENTLAIIDVEQLDCYRAPNWFQPIGGDILRQCDRFDEAEGWLNSAVRSDPRSATARAFRGKLAFDRGRFRDAITDFESAVALDSSYRWARVQFARILRTADKLPEAANEYTELLSDSPGDESFLSERAEVLLRMGTFAQADRDIAARRAERPDEPFLLYLEALSKCIQGDQSALPDAARRAGDAE
jgi:tetratricopeptide (TPR) repeat protein